MGSSLSLEGSRFQSVLGQVERFAKQEGLQLGDMEDLTGRAGHASIRDRVDWYVARNMHTRNGMLLAHGTSVDVAELIAEDGLRPSEKGMYGPGGYCIAFHDDPRSLAKALYFAGHVGRHGDERGSGAIVVFEAAIGDCHYVDELRDGTEWYGYQTPMRPRANAVIGRCHTGYGSSKLDAIPEYVLRDPKQQAVPVFQVTFRRRSSSGRIPRPLPRPATENSSRGSLLNVNHRKYLASDGCRVFLAASPCPCFLQPVSGMKGTYYIKIEHDASQSPKFLDCPGGGSCQVWTSGSDNDHGLFPDKIRWWLDAAPGEQTFYVVNLNYQKYLDTHGSDVKTWRGKDLADKGPLPSNIQWKWQQL